VLPEFGEGRVDALQVYKSNEPDTLQRAGYDVTVFKPEDSDVHFLGQAYVTHTDYIRDDPEMVRAFVRATMRGMQFILDPANKDVVTDNVMVYAGEDADRDHNEFIWTTEVEYVQSPSTEEIGVGYASYQQWVTMMDYMVSFGSLEAQLDVSAVWDQQFVQSIYENGELIWP
jgi:ABC-type nitrate/sulfonate/bicarbonate transport system substrate-binding protein